MTDDRDEVLASLLGERTVDIVTTGRRSGQPRTTEIWTTIIDGRVYICGTPNAGREGATRTPRDWMANLVAHPAFVLRLKRAAQADLTASAQPVTDPARRRDLLTRPSTEYYRSAIDLDTAVAHSPIVEVTFTGPWSWLNDEVAGQAADRN